MQKLQTSDNVKTAYNEFYKTHDEAWRMLGAKYKAYHIIDVCKGQSFKKVLEVGAGDGSILQKLSDYNFGSEYHAVEISDSGVAHVLEHVEHERLLLREIKRVSKNFVIEVPIDYKTNVDKRIRHFLAYGHINMYTPTSLRYLLQTEGFEIKKDLTSIIGPEVTRFNVFVNQKKPRTFINRFKILATFAVKNTLVELSDKFREKLANAYTVLCVRTDKQTDIF
jgi:hypothetical protein